MDEKRQQMDENGGRKTITEVRRGFGGKPSPSGGHSAIANLQDSTKWVVFSVCSLHALRLEQALWTIADL